MGGHGGLTTRKQYVSYILHNFEIEMHRPVMFFCGSVEKKWKYVLIYKCNYRWGTLVLVIVCEYVLCFYVRFRIRMNLSWLFIKS